MPAILEFVDALIYVNKIGGYGTLTIPIVNNIITEMRIAHARILKLEKFTFTQKLDKQVNI